MEFINIVIFLIVTLIFLSSTMTKIYKNAASIIMSIGFAIGLYATKNYPIFFRIIVTITIILIVFNIIYIFLNRRRNIQQ